MTHAHTSRRRLLAALGTATLGGLAGCAGLISDDDDSASTESCPPYEPVAPSTTGWPGLLGPPTNTGTVDDSAVPSGDLTLDWTAAIPTHAGHHVPIAADDTVYAHDLDHTLYAFDASTGDTRWTRDLADPVTAPAVHGDTLVVTTRTDVHAIDTTTGNTKWTRPASGGSWFDASPIIANDTVYLHRGIATHALALTDGTTRWRAPTGLPSASTPAVTPDTVYVAGDDTYIRALAPTDGSERWRTKTAARIRCNLTVVGATLLAGTDAGTIHALDAPTGRERWRHQLPPREAGGRERPVRPDVLATDGSRVYIAAGPQLVALAIGDGAPCWRTQTFQGSYASGIAIGAGHVYAPTSRDGAHLTVFDAATGAPLQRLTDDEFTHLDTGPAIADGALYLAGADTLARLS